MPWPSLASWLQQARPQRYRLALFTVNTHPQRDQNGFGARRASLDDLWKKLAEVYPSGAANLKQAIADAAHAFPDLEGRQRAIVLLGDGNSIANPIDAGERVGLCKDLVDREIAFFSVPLGNRLEPLNLHGFPNSTGGKVVRALTRESVETFVPRLLEALSVPVLYPTKLNLPAAVVEAFPTSSLPLRADNPTLLVGNLEAGLKQFDYSVTGRLAGKEVTVRASEKVPDADNENFFLVGMVDQWKTAMQSPGPDARLTGPGLRLRPEPDGPGSKLLTDAGSSPWTRASSPIPPCGCSSRRSTSTCKSAQARIGLDLGQADARRQGHAQGSRGEVLGQRAATTS